MPYAFSTSDIFLAAELISQSHMYFVTANNENEVSFHFPYSPKILSHASNLYEKNGSVELSDAINELFIHAIEIIAKNNENKS